MVFKLWSELNPKAKKELKPDFGFRNWNSLNEGEKDRFWQYLNYYFFDKNKRHDFSHTYHDSQGNYYHFFGGVEEQNKKRDIVLCSIVGLNQRFKAHSYARNYLECETVDWACFDFRQIFMNQDENVVIELLSFYCKILISERANETMRRREGETEEEYQKRLQEWRWAEFDQFSKELNEVFTDFGINLFLTRHGFAPRQDEKITTEIYKPVLGYLSHPKWKKVSILLSDSFDEYRKNTPQGYSNCITNTVSAVQAFLQIAVSGKTGKGEISKLISDARKKNIIPQDFFTQKIFDNIESIFARGRQEIGIAHPKEEYATEKNARLVLNLAMIFFQHCIQK